ncbi:MAG TPA: hypothetical protein VIK22_09200 [Candidatus Anoxymicrobiaceae bacterium]
MGYDDYETFKRAWFYVRTSRFLWPFAFVIALAGGGSASFSLWVQSPIPRGLSGLNPIHMVGQKITDFAHGNSLFWALFLVIGGIVGLAVLAAGAFAQASAIGAVADIEYGKPSGFSGAMEWGKSHFVRFFALLIGYLVVLAIFAVPSYLFWWTIGKKGFVLPCLGALILGVGFAVVVILMSVLFELAARFLVLEDKGFFESVHLAGLTLKDYWREVLLAWLYVLVVTIIGTVVSAIVIALLSSPLSWVFTTADKQHNAFLIALSMVAFILAWAIASATAGIFSITASSIWTLTFLDLK